MCQNVAKTSFDVNYNLIKKYVVVFLKLFSKSVEKFIFNFIKSNFSNDFIVIIVVL